MSKHATVICKLRTCIIVYQIDQLPILTDRSNSYYWILKHYKQDRDRKYLINEQKQQAELLAKQREIISKTNCGIQTLDYQLYDFIDLKSFARIVATSKFNNIEIGDFDDAVSSILSTNYDLYIRRLSGVCTSKSAVRRPTNFIQIDCS